MRPYRKPQMVWARERQGKEPVVAQRLTYVPEERKFLKIYLPEDQSRPALGRTAPLVRGERKSLSQAPKWLNGKIIRLPGGGVPQRKGRAGRSKTVMVKKPIT